MDTADTALSWLGAGAAANASAPRYIGHNMWTRLPVHKSGVSQIAAHLRDVFQHKHGDIVHRLARVFVKENLLHNRDLLELTKPLYPDARHAHGVMHIVKMVPRDAHAIDYLEKGYKLGKGFAKDIQALELRSSQIAELVVGNDSAALDNGGGDVYVGECRVAEPAPGDRELVDAAN